MRVKKKNRSKRRDKMGELSDGASEDNCTIYDLRLLIGVHSSPGDIDLLNLKSAFYNLKSSGYRAFLACSPVNVASLFLGGGT
jgi:hypothetical protein